MMLYQVVYLERLRCLKMYVRTAKGRKVRGYPGTVVDYTLLFTQIASRTNITSFATEIFVAMRFGLLRYIVRYMYVGTEESGCRRDSVCW